MNTCRFDPDFRRMHKYCAFLGFCIVVMLIFYCTFHILTIFGIKNQKIMFFVKFCVFLFSSQILWFFPPVFHIAENWEFYIKVLRNKDINLLFNEMNVIWGLQIQYNTKKNSYFGTKKIALLLHAYHCSLFMSLLFASSLPFIFYFPHINTQISEYINILHHTCMCTDINPYGTNNWNLLQFLYTITATIMRCSILKPPIKCYVGPTSHKMLEGCIYRHL